MGVVKLARGGVLLAALGAGVATLAPGLARAVRPRVLQALTLGIALSKQARRSLEGAWEDFEDLMAEAQAAAEARAAQEGATQAEPRQETNVETSCSKGNVKPFAPRAPARESDEDGGAHGA